jgi:hypothetical protein
MVFDIIGKIPNEDNASSSKRITLSILQKHPLLVSASANLLCPFTSKTALKSRKGTLGLSILQGL